MSRQVLHAELTWTGERFEPDVRIEIEDGRITHVGPAADGDTEPTHLERRALLPGFVNAHSHAFQRGLRGRGETFPDGGGSFWTWREAMYDLVGSLDEERFYELCRRAFTEMLLAGITTVGEFHYFHHRDASGHHRDFDFDAVVLRAASDAGIRIALLQTFYQTGDIGHPLAGAQRRFATATLGEYWEQLDRLAEIVDPRSQSLGVVAHSVRAAGIRDIAELYQGALDRDLPFHMHVEEQHREIDEADRYYGKRPMALLVEQLDVGPSFTAVHCTHTDPDDMIHFVQAGGRVCLCPLTEANLGDGIADVPGILADGGEICLGSDSNVRISMAEEMRWTEYVQRLAHQKRGVCRDPAGQIGHRLLDAATVTGAAALGVETGAVEAGRWADFLTLDLDASCLAGADASTLLDAFVLGGRDDAVAEVMVGGAWQTAREPAASTRTSRM